MLSINEVSTLNPVTLSRVVNWILLGDSGLSLPVIEPSTSRLVGKNTCSTSMHHRNKKNSILEQYNMQSNDLKAFIAIFSNTPAKAYSFKPQPVTARKN